VYQSTINRDHLIRLIRERRMEFPEGDEPPPDIENDPGFGMPDSVITCRVDISDFLAHKRAAMRAHASQISEQHFMLSMPDEAFALAFGTEWFIRPGFDGETSLL
jgi:LmbE family N-acetylglucosaminyl deacetylase